MSSKTEIKEEPDESKSSNAILSELFGMFDRGSPSAQSGDESQSSDSDDGDSDSDSDQSSGNLAADEPSQPSNDSGDGYGVQEERDESEGDGEKDEKETVCGEAKSAAHEVDDDESDTGKPDVTADLLETQTDKAKKKHKKKSHKHKKASKEVAKTKECAEIGVNAEGDSKREKRKHKKKKKHKKQKKKKKHKSHARDSSHVSASGSLKKRHRSRDDGHAGSHKHKRRRSSSPQRERHQPAAERSTRSPSDQRRHRSGTTSHHRRRHSPAPDASSPRADRHRQRSPGAVATPQSPQKPAPEPTGRDTPPEAESPARRRHAKSERDSRVVVCGENDRLIIQTGKVEALAAAQQEEEPSGDQGQWRTVATEPVSTAEIPTPPQPAQEVPEEKGEDAGKAAPENDEAAVVTEQAAPADKDSPVVKGPKKSGGIIIKSLKNSAVFEETVRQAEEQARQREEQRAAMYEDGELSDSGSENGPAAPSQPPGETDSEGDPNDSGEVDDDEPARAASVGSKSRHKSRRSGKKSESHSDSRDGRRRHGRGDGGRHSSRRHSRERSSSRRDRSDHRSRDSSGRPSRRSRERGGSRRSRSRSGDRKGERRGIDKRRLLEVARRNVQLASESAAGPLAPAGPPRDVRQLTEMCRRLRDQPEGPDQKKATDKDLAFHHPFAVKERVQRIFMKIRDSQQLPVKSHAERQLEVARFPVSSGEVHRTKELEWVPVNKSDGKSEGKQGSTPVGAAPEAGEAEEIAPEPRQGVATAAVDKPQPPDPADALDRIVSSRLTQLRQQQHQTSSWQQPRPESAQQGWGDAIAPGEFTGSTGARVLSVAELGSGQQAWAKKTQLLDSAPVKGGLGEHLLKKMGWQPGQGLGKNQDGQLTPLLLEVKVDKKGLVAEEERPSKRRPPQAAPAAARDFSGKHPISALMEICTKRRWDPPDFQLCLDQGPAHNKTFLYKVSVNRVSYQPSVASPNKKLAKASAAAACLQALGMLPRPA